MPCPQPLPPLSKRKRPPNPQAARSRTSGDTGTSFSLEVSDGTGKHTMDFVLDKNTRVQGRVKVGTTVTVEYTPSDNGQNVAMSITAQA
jgi:hypothetical protein